ncbi:MAG: hypothetical protein HY015_04475 [Bacteroidetes bacterium]|nr:hypothetical protein [Bacteroidota bacterium]MBI3482216.1 hypothetical protein [Bacteroidota bacterium]
MKSILVFLWLTSYTILAQKTADIVRIEFSSLTRGYQELVVITADSLKATTPTQHKAIKNKDWTGVIKSLYGVHLNDIEGLKSPTMKRAYDGARHSTITIITKSGKYSHSFDDEDPHEKLKPLMKVIHDTKKRLTGK